MAKITGTVKWFSNKKGFGFISPTSDNAPTKEEIFVHQTSIFSDGAYRTLAEGAEVEFEVEKEQDSGKFKAVNVTAPGGGSLKPPQRERRPPTAAGGPGPARKPRSDAAQDSEEKENGGQQMSDRKPLDRPRNGARRPNGRGPPRTNAAAPEGAASTPREPPFHNVIAEDIKAKITAAGIELGNKTTVDLAVGGARVKLGQGGYTALADASAMVGEGTYVCDSQGIVTFNWEHCLIFADGQWKPTDTSRLMAQLSLTQEGIGPVNAEETPESLWGVDKPDPKDAFEPNGFKMKRVVLTRPPGTGRGRRFPPRKKI